MVKLPSRRWAFLWKQSSKVSSNVKLKHCWNGLWDVTSLWQLVLLVQFPVAEIFVYFCDEKIEKFIASFANWKTDLTFNLFLNYLCCTVLLNSYRKSLVACIFSLNICSLFNRFKCFIHKLLFSYACKRKNFLVWYFGSESGNNSIALDQMRI